MPDENNSNTSITPPAQDQDQNNEDAKLLEARKALAGEEWAAKMEAEEREKTLREERSSLEQRLAEIRKEKEKLEIAWIEYDTKRKAIRSVLQPIQEAEKKLETEETAIEAEESASGVPESKHAVEQKRWEIQAKRKEIEQKRWAEDEKIVEIDQVIEANTARYRELLDEEEKVSDQLAQLNNQNNS